MDLKNKMITVFGANGFLGRYVIRRLAKSGAMVRVVVRYPETARFLLPMGFVGQIEIIPSDFFYAATFPLLVKGSDIVINLVGIMHEKGKYTFNQMHHLSPADLATTCKEQKVRKFIHVSALGADQNSPSIYAQTKAKGEEAIMKAFPGAHIVRPSLIAGPEDLFFNLFAKLLRYSPIMPLFYKGQTLFEPVYVDDVAAAIEQMVTQDFKPGIYELGGPKIYSFKDLLNLIQTQLGIWRPYMPLPSLLEKVIAFFGDYLPIDLITQDQLKLLYKDNVVSKGALTFQELHISPKKIEGIIKSYLK